MNNSTEVANVTQIIKEPDVVFNIYYYGLFFTLTLINIPGNILVVTTVLRHRQLRQPANYFLVSLAFSDLLMGCLYPVYNISHLDIPSVSGTLGELNGVELITSFLKYSNTCISSRNSSTNLV